jgi:ribose 5-phosphate isomerase B
VKVAIGADHAGYQLKSEIARFLQENRIPFKDFGTDSGVSVDYPDIGLQVAEAVTNAEFDRGILVCGSGIGMSITANKVPGIRAALCTDSYCARLCREHNDANILVMGERVIGTGVALDIVQTWLSTDFSGGERHAKRIAKISEIESRVTSGG